MGNTSLGLGDALQQYVLDVSLREPSICRRLREQTLTMSEATMLSSPEQVQLLLMLLKMIGARRGLEIGTFTGYTSLRLALGIPNLKMTCCDVNEEFTAIARTFWREAGVGDNIDLRLAPALETLDRFIADSEEGAFDFAYIDADKTSYRAYVERCLTLVRPGGLIAIDNTLWGGSVADPQDTEADTVALRELNGWLHAADESEFDLSLVPIGDGLTLLHKASPSDTERPSPRLAVYGSLAPGKSNHHHLADVPGTWSEGWVEGVLHDRGWGAESGFPGIELRPGAPRVAVHVLESDALPAHWARLDEFEGDEYRRTPVEVHRDGAEPLTASIYALRT